MLLTKQDYENILNALNVTPVNGLKAAQALAVLGHKVEHRIKTWYDGDPTGFANKADPVIDIPLIDAMTADSDIPWVG